MGGKSRKRGQVSKRLIDRLKRQSGGGVIINNPEINGADSAEATKKKKKKKAPLREDRQGRTLL